MKIIVIKERLLPANNASISSFSILTKALALARIEIKTEQIKSISSVEKPAVTTPIGTLKFSK